ncbi:MAG TPA: dynamin family protein [Ruminococcus sp.]|nr:dynamin family protein [Ruminococcus sp.]
MSDKNIVKIKCNPYTQVIEYFRWDSEIEEWCPLISFESPFSKPEFTKVALQHKAYEIIQYMNELYNPGNVGLDVFFDGTKEDMDDLSAITQQYFSSSNIHILPGEMHLLSATVVKKQIEDIFGYMKKMFSEYPDNEVTDAISRFSETVRPTIPICVMGLYSAGKSAFINSLIGIELLPSASDPTTAKTYKIVSGTKYEIKFTYTDDKDKKVKEVILSFNDEKYQFNQSAELSIVAALEEIKKYETIEERMYYALSIINNFDMDYNRNLPDNEKLWRVSDLIEVTLPITASVLPFNEFDFIIYDTPGSNSASNTDDTEVLKKAMEGQTNGLPIFVTTPDNMDGKDNTELIETIEKLGGALDKSNLMIVVNRADEKDCETLEKKKENFPNLKVSSLNPAGTYFVSAIIGLGSKKILFGNTTENKKGDIVPNWIDKTYSKIFRSNLPYYDETDDDEEFVRLYSYNIIPQHQFDQYAALSVSDENLAYRNSGLHAIETAIKDFALKYALYNKCRMASSYLSSALDKLEDMLTALTAEQMALSKQLKTNMTEKEKDVLNKLGIECGERKLKYMSEFNDELSSVVKSTGNSLDNSISDKITKLWDATKGEKGRKESVTTKVNELFQKEISSLWDGAKARALGFWKMKQEEFKKALISIIVESPNLTSEQKDLLKNAIMQIDGTPNYNLSFEIHGEDIVGGFWFIKKLKTDEAKKKFLDGFDKGSVIITTTLTEQSIRAFDHMRNDVESQFQYLVSKYNPKLLTLREQLKECDSKLKYISQQQVQIQRHLSEVNSLTVFKTAEADGRKP